MLKNSEPSKNKNSLQVRFGAAVRECRNSLGISQEELAWRAGLHRTYIADIERGVRNITLRSMASVAKALDVPMASLLLRTGGRADAPAALVQTAWAETARWSPEKANAWYGQQRWLVGSNYINSSAINQLEMWQADTFDAPRIEQEFTWAQAMGMTTMRVFLHDLLWQQDAPGFKRRIDQFLGIAARHGIKPVFVLFDSCWDPHPRLGPQHPPIPGVHNSGWVQGPGAEALADPKQAARLEGYVKDIVGSFAHDERILAWDVWNEPDNFASQYPDDTKAKIAHVTALLPKVFDWARSANPSQPLTSGVWHDPNWNDLGHLNAIEKTQLT